MEIVWLLKAVRPFRSFSENEIMRGRPKEKEGYWQKKTGRQATGGVSNVGDEGTEYRLQNKTDTENARARSPSRGAGEVSSSFFFFLKGSSSPREMSLPR